MILLNARIVCEAEKLHLLKQAVLAYVWDLVLTNSRWTCMDYITSDGCWKAKSPSTLKTRWQRILGQVSPRYIHFLWVGIWNLVFKGLLLLDISYILNTLCLLMPLCPEPWIFLFKRSLRNYCSWKSSRMSAWMITRHLLFMEKILHFAISTLTRCSAKWSPLFSRRFIHASSSAVSGLLLLSCRKLDCMCFQ